MKIYAVFILKWKSIIRHPMFEQGLFFRFLFSLFILSLLYTVFLLGNLFNQFCFSLFTDDLNPFCIFIFSVLPLILFDFILKFFLKKVDFQFLTIGRFPDAKKSIRFYLLIKELVSFWNCYLLLFFFTYLSTTFYPCYGLLTTIVSFVVLYAFQLLISQLIKYIHRGTGKKSVVHYYFSFKITSQGSLENYLLLSVRMIVRSPRLRQQFISFLLVSAIYFYLFGAHSKIMDVFAFRLFFTSFMILLFPLLFNQYLFSAEASFFDHLMISPDFRKILFAKYSMNVFVSFILFFIFLVCMPFNRQFFVDLTATFLFCSGIVTLLSFSSILFVTTKIDLFGAHYKMLTNPPSVQSLYVFLVYAFSIALVILLAFVFSPLVAVWFMFVSGVISILFSNVWFNYLYRCFYPNKYEKMEIFRIQ
ncbi:MAG: DUF5687 family protein [Dysgonamonadaceae bacterium]|nr:DUF5687 family protein [Dysgonamonadaceae bacterium]